MTDLNRHGDTWTGRSGGTWFRWSGAGKARLAGGRLGMRIELAAGDEARSRAGAVRS